MHRLIALSLAAALATAPACAHRQATNDEVARAVVITAGIIGMAFLLGIESHCGYDPVCSSHVNR